MHTLKHRDVLDGRYRLESFVGQGGFAEVWKVTDTHNGVNTTHALKIFAPDQKMSGDGIGLFTRDYRLTAKLRHNSLLTPTHYSVHEGSPFLIMPLCEKGSLDGRLKEGTLPDQEIAQILEQVASGLEYMHGLSPAIVHRDIKTENVLIDDYGNYLITDFGISSDTQQSLQKVTRSQQALSVSYAPPERFESPPQSLPAGDIFSLGVMLFELCTGILPWDGHGGLLLNKGAKLPNIPSHYPKRLNAIIQASINPDHNLRPTATELRKWADYYLKEQVAEMPQKYVRAVEALGSEMSSSSARKTQMMGEIEMPNATPSGFSQGEEPKGKKTQISGQVAPPDKELPTRAKDKSGNAGRIMGLIVVAIILAVTGFFGYEYFNTPKRRNEIKDISEVEEGRKDAEKVAELLKDAKDQNTPTPPTPEPDNPPSNTGKNTSSNTNKTYTPPPKKMQGRKYKPVGSIKGVFAELAKGDLPYPEKKKLKQELVGFFTDPNTAIVITSIDGTPTDAETVADFSSRVITMPKPKIQIIGMEKDGSKIQKLVVEID